MMRKTNAYGILFFLSSFSSFLLASKEGFAIAKYDFSLFLLPDGSVLLEAQNPSECPLPSSMDIDCDFFSKNENQSSLKQLKNENFLQTVNGSSVFRSLLGKVTAGNVATCSIRLGGSVLEIKSNQKYEEVKFTPDLRQKKPQKEWTIGEILEGTPLGKEYDWNDNDLLSDEGCAAQNARTNRNAFLMQEWRNYNRANLGSKKVYLAVTTSPSRLQKIHYVLQSLDLELVSNIIITLPKLYKNKKRYSISRKLKAAFPKIVYISTSVDLGPIGKIVGAVDYAKMIRGSAAQDDIFISLDDDNSYSVNFVDTYVYFSLKNPTTAGAASGLTLNFFNIPHVGFPYSERRGNNCEIQTAYKPIIEGFAGIVYRGSHVDTELMALLVRRDLNPMFGSCYLSDDLIISYVLDFNNKYKEHFASRLSNGMFSTGFRADFGYAVDEDAIHFKNTDETRSRHNANFSRYRQCYQQLLMTFCDISKEHAPFRSRQDVIKYIKKSFCDQ